MTEFLLAAAAAFLLVKLTAPRLPKTDQPVATPGQIKGARDKLGREGVAVPVRTRKESAPAYLQRLRDARTRRRPDTQRVP